MINKKIYYIIELEVKPQWEKKEKDMKVTVNDGCIACGACESVCDAVFKVEDVAVVNESAVAANESGVKEAADACPVGAIEVE